MAVSFFERINNFSSFKYLFILGRGKKFISNYSRIGLSGLIGGVSLGIANISFILSHNFYNSAVTMMMLATQPLLRQF